MYLNKLNSDQKELFLDLCIHASMSNNDFADEQKELIKMYCDEMQLDEIRFEAETQLEEIMQKLVVISSEIELKIIVLEITALILSDNIYDELESEFMKKVIHMAGITITEHMEMIKVLKEFSKIYKKINKLIYD